jgi:hypothetical protein
VFESLQQRLRRRPQSVLGWGVAGVAGYLLLVIVGMFVFDHEPPEFSIQDVLARRLPAGTEQPVRGAVTTAVTIELLHQLLHKRGGYLSNDVLPPGAWMDNIPNWEWGVLVQLRDMAKTLRNDFARSQTQSSEDPDLIKVDNHLNISNDAWMFPSAENEYGDAEHALESYLTRLASHADDQTQFYARADNLRNWLGLVEKRLGDLSQRLSASVGQVRINTDLAGDAAAERATAAPDVRIVQTPWTEIDDVFYEARGATWALLHLLRAVERDFSSVLDKKNATVSLRQIIRELENTQDPVWSPVILNGTGFGFVANHSLVMASFISRANAAVIDLRMLLERG